MSVRTVGAYEAGAKFAELLDMVNRGDSFAITRHGMPVAELRQPDIQANGNVSETIAAIRAHRNKFAAAFESANIKELIEEGRR
jgi:antitoxin (DNA-binding transcriptional repressor) of toxin-antitoxin stability system